MKVDYLIVGQGVAGSCLALKLLKEKKSFRVIDEDKDKASTVAVGVYNTLVLKRFAQIWNAKDQLDEMFDYFGSFEKLLHKKFISKIPTYRIIHNEQELVTLQKKARLPDMKDFLSGEIIKDPNSSFKMPLGFTEIKQTGRIDLKECVNSFKDYLISRDLYEKEKFDFCELKFQNKKILYKNTVAAKVVFCEGFGVKNNPYFNYLPIIGVKGEVLKIKTKEILPRGIWKAFNFLMPLEDGICYTASTYDRKDLTCEPTEKGKQEIIDHLKEIYEGEFEILEHTAGIRPTVVDRRPILGNHPNHANLFVFNGMGTRGTLLAPQMTTFLYDFMEKGKEIPKEANIRRFDSML